jgi:carbonic anhydrase
MGLTERLLDTVSERALVVDPAARPRRGIAVVTCMDPRVDPLAALGLRREDAHVLRNAGGMVTADVIESLAVSQRVLGTREVVVLHHTGCAGLDARARGQSAEASVREAVRTIIAARRVPHRGAVRGLLLDTSTGRAREIAAPPARTAHPSAAHAAGPHHTAPGAPHCAWCHRPFSPIGRSRWRSSGAYCGDLCRLAARRARGARR